MSTVAALTVTHSGLDADGYAAQVLAMPRGRVTAVYRVLYADSGWLCSGPLVGDLTDAQVGGLAEQDHGDGPTAWAFLPRQP